jgi:hypothetical protein
LASITSRSGEFQLLLLLTLVRQVPVDRICRPLKSRMDVAAQKIRREIMSDFKGLHPGMSRAASRVRITLSYFSFDSVSSLQ